MRLGHVTLILFKLQLIFWSTGSYAATPMLAGGYGHSCGLLSNGTVKCLGRADLGQVGYTSTLTNAYTPDFVQNLNNSVFISSGVEANHSCSVSNLGGLSCWGVNSYGQLGNNSTVSSASPVGVSSLATGVEQSLLGALIRVLY
jgi:alpha-tubulin suppressor-like RCC1 family protein